MPTQTTTNGNQYEEKSRRHPRWTRQENLTLIQAKEITENSPHKGRKISSALLGSSSLSLSPSSLAMAAENTEPKWVMISTYCKQQGVNRGPAQCRKRWSNLMGDYKRVKVWESKLTVKSDTFWNMRNDIRKENKLPVSFDVEVFKVLQGRETGPTGAVSPMPLQAVLAVSEDVEDEEEAADEADALMDDDLIVEDEVVWDLGDGEEAVLVLESDKKTAENLTDSSVKKICSPETISEEQHHQAFLGHSSNSKQDAVRKSLAGVSDSPVKVKRRRISTDEQISNGLEGQILKALEANKKLLEAQLDSHNKNWELDREQKKENNELLLAALGKLTDVVMKIAEKL